MHRQWRAQKFNNMHPSSGSIPSIPQPHLDAVQGFAVGAVGGAMEGLKNCNPVTVPCVATHALSGGLITANGAYAYSLMNNK